MDMKYFRFLSGMSMLFIGRLSASWMPDRVAAWGLIIVFVLTIGLWGGGAIYNHWVSRREKLSQ